jgi:hypothetical protein
MKIFCLLSTVLVLIVFLFMGCSNDDTNSVTSNNNNNNGNTSGTGFASMTVGSWAEYILSDGSHEKLEYIGIDNYQGTDCYVLEFDMTSNGEDTYTQMWLDKSSNKAILYVIKMGGIVTKMNIPQTQDIPSSSGNVPASSVKLGNKTYTTPTGKKVDAIAYQTTTTAGTSESWISLQVPFGTVKTLLNGESQMELYDFGTSGAVRNISKQEAENAQSFGIPQG